MKKFIAFISALTICIASALPIMAEFTNPPLPITPVISPRRNLNQLSENLERIRQLYDFDVDIYTESTMDADSAQDAADDIFRLPGYGAGRRCGRNTSVRCNRTESVPFFNARSRYGIL